MIIQLERSIYLASRSPRRRELLTQLGVRFELLLFRAAPAADPDVDETPLAGEAPLAYVERVACAKAVAGWKRVLQRGLPRAVVLAADTTVALGGRILGKPANRDDAAAMLASLSGRQHEVLTGVAVRNESELACVVSRSEVEFRELSPREIAQYVATGECDDKAGAYGIQGRAEQFVAALRGSLSGVMGLPLGETARLLERIAAPIERRRS